MDIAPTKSTIKIICIGIYRLKKLINIAMIIDPNVHLIKEPKSIPIKDTHAFTGGEFPLD